MRFSDDPGWWHERLIAAPVFSDSYIVLTGDNDLYMEAVSDWEEILDISGASEYPDLGRRHVVQFAEALEPAELLEVFRDGSDLAATEQAAQPLLVPALSATAGIDWDGRALQLPRRPLLDGVLRRIRGKRPDLRPGGAQSALPLEDSPRLLPPPDRNWYVVDSLADPGIFGKEVELNHFDLVLGDRALHTLRSGEVVSCAALSVEEVVGLRPPRPAAAAPLARGHGDTFDENEEVDLRRRLGRPVVPAEESMAKDDSAAIEDVRTLWVDVDSHGIRYKAWREVCHESHSERYSDSPVEGPSTMLNLSKFMERHGGNPRLWFEQFTRSKALTGADRVYHEVRVISECFYVAGTFDQVNLGGLVLLEVLARRLQAIIDAHSGPPGIKPSWEAARLFAGQEAPDDAVDPALRAYVARKAKDEAEVEHSRHRARQLRGGGGAGATADGEGGVDGAAAPDGRGRGRGRGGRSRAPPAAVPP